MRSSYEPERAAVPRDDRRDDASSRRRSKRATRALRRARIQTFDPLRPPDPRARRPRRGGPVAVAGGAPRTARGAPERTCARHVGGGARRQKRAAASATRRRARVRGCPRARTLGRDDEARQRSGSPPARAPPTPAPRTSEARWRHAWLILRRSSPKLSSPMWLSNADRRARREGNPLISPPAGGAGRSSSAAHSAAAARPARARARAAAAQAVRDGQAQRALPRPVDEVTMIRIGGGAPGAGRRRRRSLRAGGEKDGSVGLRWR